MTLKGKNIVITRPKHQAGDLAKIITEHGGLPRIVPTVDIVPILNPEEVEKPLKLIVSGKADIIIFMSQNGVSSFLDLSKKLGLRTNIEKSLKKMKVIAIGIKTKKMLETQNIRVDIMPTDHSSNGLAEALSKLSLEKKVIAIPRTDNPTNYLHKKLEGKSAKILQFATYKTRCPSDTSEILDLIDDILKSKIDVITFTSSATARNLFSVAEENGLSERLRDKLNEKVVVASIGPVTTSALKGLGVNVQVTPKKYTVDAMIKELDAYLSESNEDIGRMDKRLLIELQQHAIPLVKKPWKEIGARLGLSSNEVLSKLRRLCTRGIVRNIGPVVDSRRIGLKASTLVGMRVPKERIDDVVQIINLHDEVTHNYERNHEYNVWFTLVAPNPSDLSRLLRDICEKTKVNEKDTLNLVTKRLFKIKANFNIDGA